MLQSLREETEGKPQMLLSPRKNGLTSLFKEVRVFKVYRPKSLFFSLEELTEKGTFCRDAGRMSQGHPAFLQGVFRNFVWFFSNVSCLLHDKVIESRIFSWSACLLQGILGPFRPSVWSCSLQTVSGASWPRGLLAVLVGT